MNKGGGIQSYTAIKTDKSVKRFEKVISAILVKFSDAGVEVLFRAMLAGENKTNDSLILLFWNASYNNKLLNYLNSEMYFLAFYSGRISIEPDEVVASLKDLKEREVELKKWSVSTLQITASKYLTFFAHLQKMRFVWS